MSHPTHYLKGLNTIRFVAAFFVILFHGYTALVAMHVVKDHGYAVFDRGIAAVELFFTLSGFLITYLLILEINKTGTVDIKDFYIRRVTRIWPMYFLCLAGGLVGLGLLYPWLTGESYFDFSIPDVLWYYVFFLPNLPYAYYRAGILCPLWSIGIEEQFYLFWAPLARFFRARLLSLIVGSVVLTTAWWFFLNCYFAGRIETHQLTFLGTFRFHNMAIGALFGYLLYFGLDWYKASNFSRPVTQSAFLVLVLYYYLVGIEVVPSFVMSVVLSFIYGCIFINVSSLERPVVNLEIQPFVYLGQISYGLYMYHPFVSYGLRYLLPRLNLPLDYVAFSVLYYGLLFGITIAVSAVSYRTFETFFFRLRKLKRSLPSKSYGQPLERNLSGEARQQPRTAPLVEVRPAAAPAE